MTVYLFVGSVRFFRDGDEYTCCLCSKKLDAAEVARHAQRKHAKLTAGVLAGQLGIHECGVPDVPPKVSA